MIKKTRKVQRILEEFRGIKNISSIKSVKKRILNPKVTKRQRWNDYIEKWNSQRSRWILQQTVCRSRKPPNSMNSAARSSKEGEQYNECDKKEMLEIIADEIQSAINKLNEGKACDNNGIRAETHQGLRRHDERNDETDLQWSEIKSCTPETWRRVRIKVIHKKRKRRTRQELPPNLYSASAVQTVHDNSPQQIMLQAWLTTTRRSRRVPSILPNIGPLHHVQTYRAEKPRMVCQNVACNDWHREGI